ncbi:MAG: hypothetical protein KBT58_09720 [Bizionia sp.]|nr:hypothetical protein [Bizionia sp.]
MWVICSNGDIHHYALEIEDGIDDDCDGMVDELI